MRVVRGSMTAVALLVAASSVGCHGKLTPGGGGPEQMGNHHVTGADASVVDGSMGGPLAGDSGTGGPADEGGTGHPSGPDPSAGCNHAWAPSDVTQEAAVPGYKAAMQVVRRTMVVDAVTREYLVAVPQGYDASKLHALVFGFHGSGGTREQLRTYMNLELPADGEAVFIYPSGVLTPEGTATWDPVDPSADMQLVDALIEQYTNELCIDRKRIFATGHSLGGEMTTGIGCFRGNVFRAIAPVAPGLPRPLEPCVGQVAMLGIHSPKDTKASYSFGNVICTHFLLANMCDQDPRCGCYWTEELSAPQNLCMQTKQAPYVPGVPIELNEYDDKPPVFREYESCSPGYPVVFADHWHREQLEVGAADERYHNPPPWSAAVIWEFFDKLP
jgi:polyhydroxybutyrate depolymerase